MGRLGLSRLGTTKGAARSFSDDNATSYNFTIMMQRFSFVDLALWFYLSICSSLTVLQVWHCFVFQVLVVPSSSPIHVLNF